MVGDLRRVRRNDKDYKSKIQVRSLAHGAMVAREDIGRCSCSMLMMHAIPSTCNSSHFRCIQISWFETSDVKSAPSHPEFHFDDKCLRSLHSSRIRETPAKMSSPPESSPFPPVRRVVTGHTPSEKSVFLEDGPVAGHPFSGAVLTGLHRSDEFPASNQDTAGTDGTVNFTDLIASKPYELVSPTGTTFRAIDTPPHSKSVECEVSPSTLQSL